MNMEFQVFQGGKLIFTATARLPEAAAMKQINDLSKEAERQFHEAYPELNVRDVDVLTRWVRTDRQANDN
jgi:hypothetical protein